MGVIINGDALEVLRTLPDSSVNCCVTSPPYFGLRDYGVVGQIGQEATPEAFARSLVAVFQEVKRVLVDDGTLWLNLGDSYCSQGGLHDGRDDNQSGVGAKRIWRSGPGRADGVVDQRGQRNRNGNTVIGLKPKDLIGIPWRVAFALQDDGWYLRSDIIWAKPNPMPESVTDRPTKSHEYLFLLTKSERYFYDAEAIAERSLVGWNGSKFDDQRDLAVRPTTGRNRWQERKDAGEGHRRGFSTNAGFDRGPVGVGETRNKRSVWTIPAQPCPGAHFAVMPEALVEPCIKAGCPAGGVVLDPFGGSGTVGLVAKRMGCEFIVIDLNPDYCQMAEKRLAQEVLPLTEAVG